MSVIKKHSGTYVAVEVTKLEVFDLKELLGVRPDGKPDVARVYVRESGEKILAFGANGKVEDLIEEIKAVAKAEGYKIEFDAEGYVAGLEKEE